MNGEDLIDFVQGRFFNRSERKDAGVVHEDVESSESSDDRLYRVQGAGIVAMVSLERQSLPVPITKLCDESSGCLRR